MGTPEEVAAPRALPLLGRGRRSSPGRPIRIDGGVLVDHEAHPLRRARAREARACCSTDGTRLDASGFGARLRRGVLRRRRPRRACARWLRRRRRARAARARRRAAGPADRAGRARSSASASTTATTRRRPDASIPNEPVIFFKATTALVGPERRPGDPARRHEGRLGGRARGRHRRAAPATSPEARAPPTSPATRCTTTTPSAPSSSSAAASGSKGKSADTFAPLGPVPRHARRDRPTRTALGMWLDGQRRARGRRARRRT